MLDAFVGPSTATDEGRNYRNLLINATWFGLIDGGIFSYLSVFLARLGASPSVLGLLVSGPNLVSIATSIPGGIYAERYTDLVRLVTITGFIGRLSYLIIALLPLLLGASHLAIPIIVVWSVATIPGAIMSSAWIAVMQKAVTPQYRAQLNGTRWGLLSVVSAIAIAAYGYMLDRTSFPLGYQIVFIVSFLGNIMNLYFWSKVRVPPFFPAQGRQQASANLLARVRDYFRPILGCPEFVRFNLASVAYRLMLNTPIALFSIFWVNDLQASNTWIGLRGTAGYAALVVGYWFWGRMANRLGHRNLLLFCGAAYGLYPIFTALAPSMQWLLPAAVWWGFTAAAVDIGLFDMLLASCPEGRQPSFAAAANMLASVTGTIGPLLGAVLAAWLGVRGALLVSGILQIATAGFFVFLPSREQEGFAPAAETTA